MLIPEDHVLIRSTSVMQKICAELFNNSPVCYFEFVREYPNCGGTVKLDTLEDFLPELLQQDRMIRSENLKLEHPVFIVSTQEPNYPHLPKIIKTIADTAREKYQIDHFLLLAKNHNEYTQCYVFGLPAKETNYVNIHLTLMHSYIDKFIHYFHQQAHELIEDACKPENRLYIDDASYIAKDSSYDDKNFSASNYYAYHNNSVIRLTPSEYNCLELLAKGYVSKSIAQQLDISYRTVEAHMRNIKEKCQITRKDDLAKLFHQNFRKA